jgi:cell division protein FtsB
MTDLSKTPQEELREKTWQAATRLAIALTLFGGGYVVGYLMYGDAVELRSTVKQKQDRIVDLENERETLSTKMAKLQRDKELCDKAAKAAAAPAAAAPAAAGTAPAPAATAPAPAATAPAPAAVAPAPAAGAAH